MAKLDQTKDVTKTICWARGDSDPKGFIIQDSSGVAVDITGFSFKLTVNSEKTPTDQVNEQFSITGILTDSINGKVSFAPTAVNTAITPGTYFYDIQQTDGSGAISTLLIGKVLIVQDITKV